jgi:isoamylase
LNGERVLDDIFFIIFNAHHDSISFGLPEKKWGERWTKIMDTSGPGFLSDEEDMFSAGESIMINSRSAVLLRMVDEG